MNQPVRSPLTKKQSEIAERLKALWLQRKDRYDLTHAKMLTCNAILQRQINHFQPPVSIRLHTAHHTVAEIPSYPQQGGYMLPPFGYVLYSQYNDGSIALRAWAEWPDLLDEARRMLEQEEGELKLAPTTAVELADANGIYTLIARQPKSGGSSGAPAVAH